MFSPALKNTHSPVERVCGKIYFVCHSSRDLTPLQLDFIIGYFSELYPL